MRALAVIVALTLVASSAASSAGTVIELTDANFDEQVAKGPILIDVYATWCGHCKQLAPTWQELATELADSNIRVAKVNGPECRTLVKRLDVKAYPSIFYLRDGEMREYTAARTLSALANFGRSGWRSVKPVPFWKAPNNWFGRACGVALAAPGVAAEMVEWSKKTYGVSDVVVLFVAFAVPTTVGMLAIALVDHLVVRQATMESANARRRDERERAARAREREEAAAGGDGGWEGGGGRDAAPHLHPHPHYE